MKGSYALLIQLSRGQTIAVGSRQTLYFSGGSYAYVGSALGGFKSRLNRHLQMKKKLRWHIDYFLQKASIRSIVLCDSKERIECAIAQALEQRFDSVPGFGSSDCTCKSHLFFAEEERKMESGVMTAFSLFRYPTRLIREVGSAIDE